MEDYKISLPPYDGKNSVQLKEIKIGSAADFRGNLNENTQDIADAVDLNTKAFALWTKAWVEDVTLVYWEGLNSRPIGSGETTEDVENIEGTNIPKLINTYTVSMTYGNDNTSIVFDNHYRDNDGAEVSYINSDAGIDVKIKCITTEEIENEGNKNRTIYVRSVVITNNSTANNIRLTMEIDQKASKVWKEIIEDLSEDTIEEIERTGNEWVDRVSTEGEKQVNDITTEGEYQVDQVYNEGQDMIDFIEQAAVTKLNVVFTGNETEKIAFEQGSLEGASVYLWLDTGESNQAT